LDIFGTLQDEIKEPGDNRDKTKINLVISHRRKVSKIESSQKNSPTKTDRNIKDNSNIVLEKQLLIQQGREDTIEGWDGLNEDEF